ncbi:hypothetical protein WJX81_005678 [Elliptochloris bilobata]|uniref:Uncharacterized protein n=1 Tax=Elliptochloris bilobata TaxID=381761 RepID=A0AAW1Q9W8_9CHLO
MGDWSCSAVFGRVAHLLPCGPSLCGDDGCDEDARLILTAPEPALAECLIPPSAALACEAHTRGSSEADVSASSWEGTTVLPRAIELKEAAQNPLLGSHHLEAGGRFVSAKCRACLNWRMY